MDFKTIILIIHCLIVLVFAGAEEDFSSNVLGECPKMEGPSIQKTLANHELCTVMRNSGIPFTDQKKQLGVLKEFIITSFQLEGKISHEESDELEKNLGFFLARATGLYEKVSRKYDAFISSTKHSGFLQKSFPLPELVLEAVETSPEKATSSKKSKLGRRPLPFDDKSVRAKQYASARVRELHEPGAIVLAASQQPSPLGQLVRKTKSPSGRTAALALQAIKSPSSPGSSV